MKYKVLIAFITLFMYSCSTFNVEFKGEAEKVKSQKKIALFNIYVLPPKIARIPLIDAGVFKDKFSTIKEQVVELHEKSLDSMLTFVGSKLEEYSGAKVIYSDSLNIYLTSKMLSDNDIKTYTMDNKDDYFNIIPLSLEGKNFVDLSDFHPNNGFPNFTPFKSSFTKLCNILNLDGYVLSYFNVQTESFVLFGSIGESMLVGKTIFYDNNGESIGRIVFNSKTIPRYANEYEEYVNVFRQYYSLNDKGLRLLYLGEKPEDD